MGKVAVREQMGKGEVSGRDRERGRDVGREVKTCFVEVEFFVLKRQTLLKQGEKSKQLRQEVNALGKNMYLREGNTSIFGV